MESIVNLSKSSTLLPFEIYGEKKKKKTGTWYTTSLSLLHLTLENSILNNEQAPC
jgi:hypothetical protein